MRRFKGILAIIDEPSTDGRIVRQPRHDLIKHRPLPLPLLARRQQLGGIGQPLEADHLAGTVDTLALRGVELLCAGDIDPEQPAGQQLIELLDRPGASAAVAMDLHSFELAPQPDGEPDEWSDLYAPMDLREWTLGAVTVVADRFASWPQARIVIER